MSLRPTASQFYVISTFLTSLSLVISSFGFFDPMLFQRRDLSVLRHFGICTFRNMSFRHFYIHTNVISKFGIFVLSFFDLLTFRFDFILNFCLFDPMLFRHWNFSILCHCDIFQIRSVRQMPFLTLDISYQCHFKLWISGFYVMSTSYFSTFRQMSFRQFDFEIFVLGHFDFRTSRVYVILAIGLFHLTLCRPLDFVPDFSILCQFDLWTFQSLVNSAFDFSSYILSTSDFFFLVYLYWKMDFKYPLACHIVWPFGVHYSCVHQEPEISGRSIFGTIFSGFGRIETTCIDPGTLISLGFRQCLFDRF